MNCKLLDYVDEISPGLNRVRDGDFIEKFYLQNVFCYVMIICVESV